MVRACHATRIKKKNSVLALIPWDMSVRMQEDVDFIWHPRRRDVDEPESDAVSLQINHQRPIIIRVAVAAHERERQPDIFQLKN